ncbi:MAG: histidine kinase [Chitinophagia bacterium]|nr:histidine kinase [Chitinophagia bacterium]
MKIYQEQYLNNTWQEKSNGEGTPLPHHCQLVLAFGARQLISDTAIYAYLKSKYPIADIVLASTSGEIIDDKVHDDSIVVTAIEFQHSTVKCVQDTIQNFSSSFELGAKLMAELSFDKLKTVFVISDGSHINGSELVAGFNSKNTYGITVSGGLAGDAANFEKTATGLNSVPGEGNVIAVGFYGDNITINHGSLGGWDEFGTERIITHANKNVLYELDGKSALTLYKEYLGDYVKDLPGSALLFPLALNQQGDTPILVRTILSIDEENRSMTFAGNMPVGSKVRLMKANFDKLISASSTAAEQSLHQNGNEPSLAILISCIGRKLILQHRTEEEVEVAKEIFGTQTAVCGFYSYGELSPYGNSGKCELHNQTMTITTISENA